MKNIFIKKTKRPRHKFSVIRNELKLTEKWKNSEKTFAWMKWAKKTEILLFTGSKSTFRLSRIFLRFSHKTQRCQNVPFETSYNAVNPIQILNCNMRPNRETCDRCERLSLGEWLTSTVLGSSVRFSISVSADVSTKDLFIIIRGVDASSRVYRFISRCLSGGVTRDKSGHSRTDINANDDDE
jgi:hypothetical protein